MRSLEESPYPLAFRVADAADGGWSVAASPGPNIRVLSRALSGMQKEAIVLSGPSQTAWRMVSDEGPYLNGTDLAPFPLAFFTTGLVASCLERLVELSRLRDAALPDIRVVMDSRYSMEGSALRGTMRGAALPVTLRLETGDGNRTASELVSEAAGSCLGVRVLHQTMESVFSLRVNRRGVRPGKVNSFSGGRAEAPTGFDAAAPDQDPGIPQPLISKLPSPPPSADAGGPGSSLASDQKRTLHIRGIGTIRADGIHEVRIELFRPAGSCFRLLSDRPPDPDRGQRAPSAAEYLAAAVAFCFMTQLGRYAHIVRKPLADYRLIQDMGLGIPPGRIRTQVFLEMPDDTPESADYGATLVEMGAQTCFLHAACGSSVPVEVA